MLEQFTPPGGLDDLSERGRRAWSRDLNRLIDANVAGDPSVPNDSPRPQFFNPLGLDLDGAARHVMRWGAFPRKLARQPTPERWALGDQRDLQEEYCEWSATRDRRGRITAAFFTTEVPSYFHMLGADDPQRLLAIYRTNVDPAVQLDELMAGKNRYRERNRWNLQGAMHMIQGSNTLPAAVLLVAQSTIRRQRDGAVLTNATDLIRCGVNADIARNSDPLIVGDVNDLARRDARITLEDPVGLYLEQLRTDGWEAPEGADPAEFWQVTRGGTEHALRAVYTVPPGRGFTVSEITINGEPIVSPSQIAEFLSVKVSGIADGLGANSHPPRGCRDDAPAGGLERLAAAEEDLPSVDELVAEARASR